MGHELTAPLFTAPAAAAMANSFELFGNYLLLKKIGTGGMAEVFLARPASRTGNGRVQVIKRILPHMADDPVFLDMFQAEVQVMMGFNHPHTVQLHDFGTVNNQLYIAMEYIEGKNLKQIVAKFRKKNEMIPVPMVLSLLAQAAAGLGYAHAFENKITGEVFHAVHRDISPQNLILSYDGNLKVIDFGIAKAESDNSERTRTGIIKGKVAYLSPEQVQAQPLDGRSDIFSLGIVAWELLTFQRPFSDENDNELTVMNKIENCEKIIVAPSKINKEVPREVDALIMKALRRDPRDRYSTAVAFQTAIRQVMRQYYPSYAYSDTGELIRALFEDEIRNERHEVRELNIRAQESLNPDGSLTQISKQSNGVSGSFTRAHEEVSAPNFVESRLSSIEALMKQKATGKHYLLFAVYVFSLVAMKLDDRYLLLDRLLGPPPEYQQYLANAATTPPVFNHAQNFRVVAPAAAAASTQQLSRMIQSAVPVTPVAAAQSVAQTRAPASQTANLRYKNAQLQAKKKSTQWR